MLKLGVNIDHVATLRQARFTPYPSPVKAAGLCMKGGADGITAHLREDRRHIQDYDISALKEAGFRLNMEMAVTPEMVAIASKVKPEHCCLVPEKRQELTTEGGLDVIGKALEVRTAVSTLSDSGIIVSLFIDPDNRQIEAAFTAGAKVVELHTGAFANAKTQEMLKAELIRLKEAAIFAHSLGITVNAGHGIDYSNLDLLMENTPYLNELNIGHSIVSRAVFVGLETAVREMLSAMSNYKF